MWQRICSSSRINRVRGLGGAVVGFGARLLSAFCW